MQQLARRLAHAACNTTACAARGDPDNCRMVQAELVHCRWAMLGASGIILTSVRRGALDCACLVGLSSVAEGEWCPHQHAPPRVGAHGCWHRSLDQQPVYACPLCTSPGLACCSAGQIGAEVGLDFPQWYDAGKVVVEKNNISFGERQPNKC